MKADAASARAGPRPLRAAIAKNGGELVPASVHASVRKAPVSRSVSPCPPAQSLALAIAGAGLASARMATFLPQNTNLDSRGRSPSFSCRAC
eukprot:7944374-Pyramimonas_sp.AAC.1